MRILTVLSDLPAVPLGWQVSSELIALGLEAWPLLSSYPHPPEFMDWMRQVFQNPDPFIKQVCHSDTMLAYI